MTALILVVSFIVVMAGEYTGARIEGQRFPGRAKTDWGKIVHGETLINLDLP
jgi:hypothetical protein